jgi:hypothetical protein
MDLTAVSLGAASAISQNYAALAATNLAIGQNPTPNAVSGQGQAATQAQFSMDVLKKTLDIQAADGAQLAQLIGSGPGVDIQA